LKTLVTGAAGFIGSHLCEYLIEQGCRVLGIDCFMDNYPRAIKEANISNLRSHQNFEFVEGSLLEVDITGLLDRVNLVFHQSALAGVRTSWGKNFKVYTDNNILGTQTLLEACKEQRVEKFIFASSSSVYGETRDLPMRESSLPFPVSPYGVSKLAAEHLCLLYHKNFGIPIVALRYFTVYGPRQRPDMAFHRFLRWALEDKPIEVYGDGKQSRDFTHVNDIVAANWLAVEKAQAGEVYNVGGGSRVTLNQVVEIMKELVGREIEVRYMETQKGDVRHTYADMTKAKERLGYQPGVSIQDGLRTEFEWIQGLLSR